MTGRFDPASSAATGGSAQRDRLLVAVDVDGTLLNTEFDDDLRPREAKAIGLVTAAGHVCAFCTGRNRRSLARVLAGCGDEMADLPQVLLNGAVVIGGRPRRVLQHNCLDRGIVAEIVRIFREHDVVAMVYDSEEKGGLLYHEDRQANSVLSRYLARRRNTVGHVVPVTDLLSHLPAEAVEVGTIDRYERIAPLTEQINRELAGRVKVVNTQTLLARDEYCWAEIYHPACSKGQGTLLLAREYGIPPGKIVALGDNFNDLDLFAMAGFSVAMQNAPAEVRAAADTIAPTVAESGAAVILEKIALGIIPPDGAGSRS